LVTEIRKRDGRVVGFDPQKITTAIMKAIDAVGGADGKMAKKLSDQVVEMIHSKFGGQVPGVEDVQDVVEAVLIQSGYEDVAKAYILYRQKRTELREAKKFFVPQDELKLSLNATSVLTRRYLLRDIEGNIIETPSQMFRRVARHVAAAELQHGPSTQALKAEAGFYEVMARLQFVPNSPTLMNAGTPAGQLSACFVLPVEDSIRSIFDQVKNMALIHQSGGGTGFSFSRIRPRGSIIESTKGIASGPVSFMMIYDTATDVMKRGGKRRGANMGILRVDHPDILDFITAKEKEGVLTNFNMSVAVTDDFMEAVKKNDSYPLVDPHTGTTSRKLNASDVFNLIVAAAWRTGDPGLIFIDEVNRHNVTPRLGSMEATNPCGEMPLLPYESCNLGSINLSRIVDEGDINWQKLEGVVRSSVHFLDNAIDVNKFPLPEIERATKATRKIGLGVMGFAEALIKMSIPYDSDQALDKAEQISAFISEEAREKSAELAEERGSFPAFAESLWESQGYRAMRNATLTTIAPTGSISIVAGTTSGIEPLFAVAFVRSVMGGTQLVEVNPVFETIARERGFHSDELTRKIAKTGSVKGLEEVPSDLQGLFLTALEIPPERHVRMQAAFQKNVDNAVSKTVNLPSDASIGDVEKVFMLAYELKCKGITVYRYGSKKEQVLYMGSIIGRETGETLQYVSADPEYAGGCLRTECPTA